MINRTSIVAASAVLAVVAISAVAGKFADLTSERTLAAYATSLNGRSPEQIVNIARAADRLNNRVVLPGGVFSVTRALGDTGASRGYKAAPVFVQGSVEEAIAGGICQVSSTLYNAVLLADMDIVERHAHSRPVGSVPLGRDATVAAGVADLQFRNNREEPVRVLAEVAGAQLLVRVAGAGERPPRIHLNTTTSRVGNSLVVSLWKQSGDSRDRVMVSRDEYQAAALGPAPESSRRDRNTFQPSVSR